MRDRIRKIMENEHMTPSMFADKLDIGRAVISHILNGRNNPSLDVVSRILSHMDNINSDWLLTGKGEMLKPKYIPSATVSQTNIFEQNNENQSISDQSSVTNIASQQHQPSIKQANNTTDSSSKVVETSSPNIIDDNKIEKQPLSEFTFVNKGESRKVSKIIIYYTDNTFEIFEANNKPL